MQHIVRTRVRSRLATSKDRELAKALDLDNLKFMSTRCWPSKKKKVSCVIDLCIVRGKNAGKMQSIMSGTIIKSLSNNNDNSNTNFNERKILLGKSRDD